jgi:phosphoadenosine phosphosulfate reductase
MARLPVDFKALNDVFEQCTPQQILAWSWETFGASVVVSSSFQTQSVALLHMISQVCPRMPVLFLDTGYHFPETLAYRDQLRRIFRLVIRMVYPMPNVQSMATHFPPMYQVAPDRCCRLRKVEPMRRALHEMDVCAWVSGVRRDQTDFRKGIEIIEREESGLLKIHPLANWTKYDLWQYINQYDLPVHPLFLQGYPSIGCQPCTRPVLPNQDERSGRWVGQKKTECGLHTTVPPVQTPVMAGKPAGDSASVKPNTKGER